MSWIYSRSLRNQRLIASGMLALLVLVGGFVIALPIKSKYDAREANLTRQMERLERLRALAASEPAILEAAQKIAQDPRFMQGVLPISSETQAASAVQARIRKILQNTEGDIRSMTNLASRDENSVRITGVSVTAVLTLDEFHDMLSQLESGQPNLFLSHVNLKYAQRRQAGARDDGSQRDLVARFDVEALARNEGAAS